MADGKKIVYYGCAGCGIATLLLVTLIITGVGILGFQFYQFGKNIGDTYGEMLQGYHELEQKYPFQVPENGVLDQERLVQFLSVRDEITVFANESLNKIGEIGDAIGEQFDTPGFLSKLEGLGKVKDIVSTAAKSGSEIGKFHASLLEAQQMSPQEYQWLITTVLGTLAKAENHQFTEVAQEWDGYMEKFKECCKKHEGLKMNIGRREISGRDMNPIRLMRKIRNTEFKTENAETIQRLSDRICPSDETPTFDYLTLHLHEILTSMANDAESSLTFTAPPVNPAGSERDWSRERRDREPSN
jgi:hypothetical protein